MADRIQLCCAASDGCVLNHANGLAHANELAALLPAQNVRQEGRARHAGDVPAANLTLGTSCEGEQAGRRRWQVLHDGRIEVWRPARGAGCDVERNDAGKKRSLLLGGKKRVGLHLSPVACRRAGFLAKERTDVPRCPASDALAADRDVDDDLALAGALDRRRDARTRPEDGIEHGPEHLLFAIVSSLALTPLGRLDSCSVALADPALERAEFGHLAAQPKLRQQDERFEVLTVLERRRDPAREARA